MRIFAKKAFKFINGGDSFTATPLAFSSAPDWIKTDNLYKWAVADGDIEVINSKQDEIKAELEASQLPTATDETADISNEDIDSAQKSGKK